MLSWLGYAGSLEKGACDVGNGGVVGVAGCCGFLFRPEELLHGVTYRQIYA